MIKKIKKLWKKDLEFLHSNQLAKYEDALEVLRLMRKGDTITDAGKEVRISFPTIKKYVGSALKIKGRILVAKSSDDLLRGMRIYEDGEEKWIQVKGLKNASKIGKYQSATGQLVEGKKEALKEFEDVTIRDIKGKLHKLETNPRKIFEIFDRREEPEFFTIYRRP